MNDNIILTYLNRSKTTGLDSYFVKIMTWQNNVIVTLHNDSTETFYTGNIVTGIITLDLKNELKVESIDMEIVGISKAQWTRFSPTLPYLKIYAEKRKIFFVQHNLFFNDILLGIIPAGVHCYPFHISLPHDLPSSFKSSIASVNYYIKIKSKPAYKLRKIMPFNVLANVNLNNLDEMLTPCDYDFHQFFRGSTKVIVHLRTYISFASRQIIPFEVKIKNEEKVKIKKIRVILIQKLCYTVSSGYAEDEKEIYQVEYKKMENTLLEVCNFDMEIPQVAPSSINSAEPMIDISYEFRVEVVFFYHLNLIKSIPVTVAAVPVIHHDF